MDPIAGTAIDARAMSSAIKVEEDDVQSLQQCNSSDPEFLKLVKLEEDPPSSAPSATGLIKPPPATAFEALITDLKNESCKEANQEIRLARLEMKRVGDEYDELTPWQEAVCGKDVGIGLIKELSGFSGIEGKVESKTVKEEDSLEFSSGKNEDVSTVSSEVVTIRLIVEEASANEKILDDVRDDEDGAQPGREAVFINNEEESEPPTSVESIPLEIETKEMQLTKDEMAANDDDGPPPGWEAKVVNDEIESVVHASHESISLEVKMEEVQPNNLVKLEFENNDGDGGPQPRWEAMITKDEVEHVPMSAESVPWEIQMKEAQTTHNNLVKPKLENNDGDNEPQTGWEATITKDEVEHVPLMSVGSIPWEIQMKEARPTHNNLVKSKLQNNDGDDGPQPGWEATVTKDELEHVPLEIQMNEAQPTQNDLVKPELENNDGDDEPPPGWEATITKDEVEHVPLMSVESIPLEIKTEKLLRTKNTLAAPDLENDDDIDGPPPGMKPTIFKDDVELEPMPLALVENIPLEIKTEEVCYTKDKLAAPGAENNNENNGPPPGWETSVTKDEVDPVPSAFAERIMLDIKTEELQPTKENIAAPNEKYDDNDRQPPGWEAALSRAEDGLVKLAKRKEREEEPRPSPRPPSPCKAPSPIIEMGQLVCGSCQRLLSYAKGAKYVQCACCQTVSFVLEAHQVGQVYCGNCSVLLMYCFGSPAVKCSGCKFVTQITPHNRRPPLSEQGVTLQSQLAQLCPRSTTNLAQ